MIRLGIIFLTLFMFIVSCTDYSVEIHIDESKKAIVSCRGNQMREVNIEGPDSDVRYEGADTIYFNRKNKADRITVYLDENNDYILKLKPNSTYTIRSYPRNGDQGVFHLIIKT